VSSRLANSGTSSQIGAYVTTTVNNTFYNSQVNMQQGDDNTLNVSSSVARESSDAEVLSFDSDCTSDYTVMQQDVSVDRELDLRTLDAFGIVSHSDAGSKDETYEKQVFSADDSVSATSPKVADQASESSMLVYCLQSSVCGGSEYYGGQTALRAGDGEGDTVVAEDMLRKEPGVDMAMPAAASVHDDDDDDDDDDDGVGGVEQCPMSDDDDSQADGAAGLMAGSQKLESFHQLKAPERSMSDDACNVLLEHNSCCADDAALTSELLGDTSMLSAAQSKHQAAPASAASVLSGSQPVLQASPVGGGVLSAQSAGTRNAGTLVQHTAACNWWSWLRGAIYQAAGHCIRRIRLSLC